MDPFALLGLVALLFVKEAGLPVPVPGDLLVLGAGVAAAGDPAAGVITLVAVLVAGYAGGCIQFVLARGTLRRVLIDLLVRIGVPRARLEALADRLRRGGARGVAVARATPGLRVGAIAAAGLASLRLSVFMPGLVAGNTVFVGGHFALGYVIGPAAVGLVTGSGTIVVAVAIVVVLAGAGAVGWSRLRRRGASHALGAVAVVSDDSVYGSWADAACPVCLAIATMRSTGR